MGWVSLHWAKIFLFIISIILLVYGWSYMIMNIVYSQHKIMKNPCFSSSSSWLLVFGILIGIILIGWGTMGIIMGWIKKSSWTTVMMVFYHIIV